MANKRLIDANALKEKLQDHHDFFVDGVGGFRFLTPKDKARVDEITHCIAEIVNAPTVDAVEVVRCEKCRYYEKAEYDNGYKMVCRLLKRQTAYNGFCYCGAKMDGGVSDGLGQMDSPVAL